jgi:hypothetical protein
VGPLCEQCADNRQALAGRRRHFMVSARLASFLCRFVRAETMKCGVAVTQKLTLCQVRPAFLVSHR